MSVYQMTVSRLIEELKKFPGDTNVVGLRPSGYRVAAAVEFDGLAFSKVIPVRELMSVYVFDLEPPPEQDVLLLSPVPVEDIITEALEDE